ncbi:AMP-binding protein [Mahella australiensis]|uniref:Phytochrome sensor protein n=1 Tax=Mahella australiensis (strain DSM 15567 / CIP 107919 / 50-1 BON) TaxID=697281 RepID=F3ZYV2_MAHA5|nr:AMP-binding protein [Mahella australiensis]AEE95697.1 putative phytochrome sensor protein [Mahella australiensis 50-1 BON]
MDSVFEQLLEDIHSIVSSSYDRDYVCDAVVQLLYNRIPYYDWVGFYFMEDKALVLGPYRGRPTEHVRIEVGQGICGQAAVKGHTVVVDDVSMEDNYLACSLQTQSEIVVPIKVDGYLIGEIDIDSDTPKAFGIQDKSFLEEVAQALSRLFKHDYPEYFAKFKLDVPEYFNFACDIIDRRADENDKQAMLFVDREGNDFSYNFSDFKRLSNKAANLLKKHHVRKGANVFIMLPRIPQWWECMLACFKAGVIAIPGTSLLMPEDIEYRINAAHIEAVVTDSENAYKFEEIKGRCPTLKTLILADGVRDGWIDYRREMKDMPDTFKAVKSRSSDPAMMYFTSGTTGLPKMTLHAHSYALAHKITGELWIDLKPEDLHFNFSDTGWAKAGWSSIFGPWNAGASVFIPDLRGKFNPTKVLELIEQYDITTFCAAPTTYRMLVQEDLSAYKFAKLRHCVAAGEPLNPEVIRKWQKATGITIRDGYGQSESVVLIANFPFLDIKPGSMGIPSPGFDIAVVDEDGRRLPPDQEGDIAVNITPVRPAGLFKEYWKDPKANAERTRGHWYLTGDKGYMDDDGYFWFIGRADDVIISSGYRIGPFEVESELLKHPAVAEAAVVASPDDVRGEIVKAFVVLAPGYEPSGPLTRELQEFVKANTAPYKYPRAIEFVNHIPKTISGKIKRAELKAMEYNKHNPMDASVS